jgi:hypothetical protein
MPEPPTRSRTVLETSTLPGYAHGTARAEPSKVAKNPSPAVSTSRPR